LAGRAENGQAVFLYAEGKLVASAFVEDGRFRFDGVREKGPYGVRSLPVAGRPPSRPAPAHAGSAETASVAGAAPRPGPPPARPAGGAAAGPGAARREGARAPPAPAPPRRAAHAGDPALDPVLLPTGDDDRRGACPRLDPRFARSAGLCRLGRRRARPDARTL